MPADDDHRLLLDEVLAAAGDRLGCRLTVEGDPLPGGDRSVVVRARRSDSGGTVIVKGYDAARAGEGWIREAAALTALSRPALSGHATSAPGVLAVDAEPPLVVMEDLGAGESLATALLGDDPVAAERATVEWAEALADLHAATWNDTGAFEAALAELAGPLGADADAMPGVLSDGVQRLRRAADPLGVEVGEQVADEVQAVVERLGRDLRVLSPSDTCPDNNLRTVAGTRLIDFEAATVAHPAWDLAYLRVPWPTCWCAWGLPEATADRALQAWWDRVAARLPPSAPALDRAEFEHAVRLAAVVWCLVTAGWFLPRAQTDGRAGGEGTPPSPQLRDVVQHRLGLVATCELPELAESRVLAGRLSAALEREWRRRPLLLAPAFRTEGSGPASPR